MSRKPAAAVAGVLFVLAYMVAVTTLPDVLPPMHWTVEAVYWLAAGTLWVLPVRWLMFWAVHRR